MMTYVYLLLSVSAYMDIRSRRIPNWWLFLWVCGWFLLFWSNNMGNGTWQFFQGFFAVTALFFPLFALRMIGASDVKLMAVLCGALGIKTGILVICFSFFLGAIWAAVLFIKKVSLTDRLSYFLAYFRHISLTKQKIPYYLPSRDGYDMTLPFGACLLLGMIVYSLWFLL